MITNILQRTGNETSVEQSHRRDREVAELFDQNYTRLRGLAFVMLGDSALAEEVVMEAFAKACASWRRFSRTDRPPAYLRQMVVNLCRSKIRRRRIESRVNVFAHRAEEMRQRAWDPGASDLHLDLWDAVRRLPERQRACVVLRYLEDLPEAQIAEILQCSIGTVKSQLHRARQGLERTLGADFDIGEATSAVGTVHFEGGRVVHSTADDESPIRIGLGYRPSTPGYYLLVLRDENDEVFDAEGAPLEH